MSIKRVILILIFLKLYFNRIQSKETTCLINGKKSLNVVNERFLSFSIDPAILLTEHNLSSTSIKLAQHLSPAFIRIAGPSTELLKFSQNESFPEGPSDFTITPMMWKSLNYWIKNANLTPVFAVSDKNRTKGVWNPKSILPLLDTSGKMNFTCYWQLGYDCKDKSIVRYKHDLFTLKQALDEHSSGRKYWKIVGSDLQGCLSRKNPELARKTLEFLEDVTDAVIWQEQIWKNPAQFPTTPIPIWLVVPKLTHPTTFSSGLLWANQIGDAARAGYEVIFREPSLQELSGDTPVYWISLVHKNLMGRTVLEVRTNSFPEPNLKIYAHCTKNQDNYAKQGAVTIFVVNNSTSKRTTSLRVAAAQPGSIEVQSYIITSDGEDSTNTYLNGGKLTLDNLQDGPFQFLPTLRRVRVNKLLNLVSPPKSVAFFVLPAAKIPVCIRKEAETHVLIENLNQDQDIKFSAYPEQAHEELRAQIPEGYDNFDQYYDLIGEKSNGKRHQERKHEPKQVVRTKPMVKDFLRFLINKPKPTKGDDDKTTKLEIIFTERPAKNQTIPSHIQTVELELTSEEIKKILTDRAKSKVVESNVNITSQELENILKEATNKVIKNEEPTIAMQRKRKRFAGPNVIRKANNKAKAMLMNRQRPKRDINMELLDLQTSREKPSKGAFINNQQIEATIRKVGQTSEELFRDTEKSEERHDVFAELASSLEKYTHSNQHHNEGIFRRPFGSKAHLDDVEEVPKEELCPGAKYLDERVRFLMEPSGIEAFLEEDLENYHTFLENVRSQKMVNPRPKFSNEVRNMGTFRPGSDLSASNKVKPLEIGEWDVLSRGNHEETSSGLVGSPINNEVLEVNPFAPEFEEKAKNQVLPELATPQPKQGWEIDSFSQSTATGIEKFAPWDAVTPPFNKIWEKDEFSQENTKNPTFELVEAATNTGTWQIDTFSGENVGKAKIPSVFHPERPQIEKWDQVFTKNNENPTLSKAVPSSKQELWEINSETHGNTQNNIPKPLASKALWEMDIVSQKGDGNKENLPLSDAVANPHVEVWEINAFPPENVKKIENPSFWSPNTEKPQLDMEMGNWDRLSRPNDGNAKNPFASEGETPGINNQIKEADLLPQGNNEKLENSSAEVARPWTGEQTWTTKTFFQENVQAEDQTSNDGATKKPETARSSKMIETIARKTMTKLENYFCDPKNTYQEQQIRFKREDSDITNNDIKNYKKFMQEQLRVMKKARQSKLQVDDPSRAPPKMLTKAKSKLSPADPKDTLSSDGEHLHIVIGKPYDPEKLHINERRRAKQVQKLKQRFQNRKKLNEKIRERKLQQNEVPDDHSSSRRKRTPYNIHTNEVSDKKKQTWNRIEKYYQRRVFRPKAWNPQDITKVKKVPSYSIEVVDKREFLQRTAPFVENNFKETKRHKRTANNDIDSSENAIEDYPLIKNKKFRKFFADPKKQFPSTKINLRSTTEETNEINSGISVKTLEFAATPSTHLDGKTDSEFSNNQTQKPGGKDKEVVNTDMFDSIIPPDVVDWIMGAVNTTVSGFVHLTEKISKHFSL